MCCCCCFFCFVFSFSYSMLLDSHFHSAQPIGLFCLSFKTILLTGLQVWFCRLNKSECDDVTRLRIPCTRTCDWHELSELTPATLYYDHVISLRLCPLLRGQLPIKVTALSLFSASQSNRKVKVACIVYLRSLLR